MNIQLTNLTKKFVSNTLFKDLNANFSSGNSYAVTGPNGSGKSTLLKIISGYLPSTSGTVNLLNNEAIIPKEEYYKHINICAPYLDLIDELTLNEHLEFHGKFKKTHKNTDILSELEKANLSGSLNKPVNEFSSGMKQRLKIILATCYQSEVLLMDEPSSHLDKVGKKWYIDLMTDKIRDRITLFFSNDEEEFIRFTDNLINIELLNQTKRN